MIGSAFPCLVYAGPGYGSPVAAGLAFSWTREVKEAVTFLCPGGKSNIEQRRSPLSVENIKGFFRTRT